jgi:hypothetical protein
MVSREEKDRLDDVAEDAFGTTEVPYGAVTSMLVEQYNKSNDSNAEENI